MFIPNGKIAFHTCTLFLDENSAIKPSFDFQLDPEAVECIAKYNRFFYKSAVFILDEPDGLFDMLRIQRFFERTEVSEDHYLVAKGAQKTTTLSEFDMVVDRRLCRLVGLPNTTAMLLDLHYREYSEWNSLRKAGNSIGRCSCWPELSADLIGFAPEEVMTGYDEWLEAQGMIFHFE